MEIPNPNIFREYDIRGIAEEELTDDIIEAIGMAYGTLIRRNDGRHVVIAGDVRKSTSRIIVALAQGLLRTGLNVLEAGMLPTPGLYYSVMRLGADAGAMVTGSHNPIEYNGIKLSKGKTGYFGQDIQTLKHIIESGDYLEGRGDLKKVTVSGEYIDEMHSSLRFGRRLKVVLDAGNGIAGPFASIAWERYAEIIPLFMEPDGSFPNHLPDPTVPEYTETLRQTVLETGADIGFGYDGDGDRMAAVDDKGRLIPADIALVFLAKDMLIRRPGKEIIFDVKCSDLVPKEIKKAGGRSYMYKTGHSLIKNEMHKRGCFLAGEMSGHIFIGDNYHGFDDGIYASLRLGSIISRQDKKFSEMVDALPKYVNTPEIRVDCDDNKKFEIVETLQRLFQKERETITIDGARVQYKTGWGLVRASNTQPILVLRFEAQDETGLKNIVKDFNKKLKAFPEVNREPLEKYM